MSASLGLAIVVHALHVGTGMIWIGGQAALALAVWPAVLERPPAEARALLVRLVGPVGRVMAISGAATLVLGLVRAAGWSTLRGPGDLVATPYGVTLLVAAAITVALSVHGARGGRLLAATLAAPGDDVPEDVRRALRRGGAISIAGGAFVLACMTLMHFGL